MRLVLLDDPGVQRQVLYDVLTSAGHQVLVGSGLLEIRRLCKNFVPDICLVELVRCSGNGFALAVFLQKIGAGETVLLSDRDLDADRLWAQARGIRFVLTRVNGRQAFLSDIEKIASCHD